jgi:hypothetical protein
MQNVRTLKETKASKKKKASKAACSKRSLNTHRVRDLVVDAFGGEEQHHMLSQEHHHM